MRSLVIVLLFLGMIACQEGQKKEEKKKNPLVEMIDNPISAQAETDSSKVAAIVAESYLHRFDTVPEGGIVDHTFFFVNEGKQPLNIFDARSECGCTVAEYSDGIIAPGKRGFVKVSFDTDTKTGFQERPVYLFANTLPQKTTFTLSGYVVPK